MDMTKKANFEAEAIYHPLSEQLEQAVGLAKQRVASSWLTVAPLSEHDFTLHKVVFHDAIPLRYGWTPTNMPPTCVCGKRFGVEHALSSSRGEFPSVIDTTKYVISL